MKQVLVAALLLAVGPTIASAAPVTESEDDTETVIFANQTDRHIRGVAVEMPDGSHYGTDFSGRSMEPGAEFTFHFTKTGQCKMNFVLWFSDKVLENGVEGDQTWNICEKKRLVITIQE